MSANILRRTYGTVLQLGNFRNETAHQSFSDLREVPMTSQAIEGACAFAWRNYLLLHSGIVRTIAGVPPSFATSPIFAVPANMISISCK